MSDRIEEKLESRINLKLSKKQRSKSLDDGFKKNKVINEVLDKPTIFELYELIKSNIISYVNGVVQAGKESVVFWAVGPNESNFALKIYLVTTSNFKKRSEYLIGDSRFSRIKKGTKNIHKTITISILNPINAGMEKENFLKTLENKIYNELNLLN